MMDKPTVIVFLGFITCVTYYIAIEIYDIENSTDYGRYKTYMINQQIIANTCNPINTVHLPDETYFIDGDVYPKHVPQFLNKSLNLTCLSANTKPKVILFWNKDEKRFPNYYATHHTTMFKLKNCSVRNCQVTMDRARYNESRLIVINMDDKLDALPKWRKPYQRWIFEYNIESELTFEKKVRQKKMKDLKLKSLNGLFNMTATYKLNSNFTPTYLGKFMAQWEENEEYNLEDKDFMGNKSKMAFIISSKCDTTSKRELYVAELQKHIDVDVYGKCGTPCPNINDKRGNEECQEMLIPQYKFYFAFESSFCNEYITEKFFSKLKHDIIPVVYGAGPYDEYIPKSAYINVLDYKTPKQLAEYLHKVASNKELYNSFFKWKRYIKFINYPRYILPCELCIMLNLEQHYGTKRSIINNLDEHLDGQKNCKIIDKESLNF